MSSEGSDNAGDAGETVDEPVLDQNSVTAREQLDGIADQTRADLGDESQVRYEEVLRQRLADAGHDLTDDEVTALARRSAGGGGV